jgi:hypothetical protein
MRAGREGQDLDGDRQSGNYILQGLKPGGFVFAA